MISLLLGAFGIGFASILVKATSLGPTVIGAYRCAIGAAILIPLGMILRRRAGKRAQNIRAPANTKTYWLYIVGAGVFFAVDLYVWHRAVIYAGAGMGTILGNTQAFYLALFGVLFAGERLTGRLLTAVPLAFLGIMLLVKLDPATGTTVPAKYWWGVAYGLMTGVVYAGFLICLKQSEAFNRASTPADRLGGSLVVAALLLLVTAAVDGELELPYGRDLFFILCLGIGVQVGAWLLITRGLSKIAFARAGLILLVQPATAALLGAFLFDEALGPTQILGAAITLTAIYLGTVRK